jgi:hypothetical protein
MAELVQDSIMNGTVNSHGMSDQIISIIQMQLAWALVITVPITPDTIPMLRDIIKVIMDTETNTMTTAATATSLVAEVEAEVAMVAGVMQHSFPSNLAQVEDSVVPIVRQDRVSQDLRQMWLQAPLVMSMNLAGRYVKRLKPKIQLLQKQLQRITTMLLLHKTERELM